MKYTDKFTSSTDTHINYTVYVPSVAIRYRAIIQVHHGIMSHSGCYDDFYQFLSNEGYVVIAADFPGHGSSLKDFEQGDFGKENVLGLLVQDMQRLRIFEGNSHGELPYFIVGIDLGSLVLREYLAEYGDFITGAILIGTCDKIKNYNFNKFILESLIALKGNMYRSKRIKNYLYRHIFKSQNRCEYLTKDKKEIVKYEKDPFTDFVYTARSYLEMLKMTKEVSRDEIFKETQKDTSILLLSGEYDSLGHNGNDIKKIADKYLYYGVQDVTCRVVSNDYQDILHEVDRKEIYQYIIRWIEERIY